MYIACVCSAKPFCPVCRLKLIFSYQTERLQASSGWNTSVIKIHMPCNSALFLRLMCTHVHTHTQTHAQGLHVHCYGGIRFCFFLFVAHFLLLHVLTLERYAWDRLLSYLTSIVREWGTIHLNWKWAYQDIYFVSPVMDGACCCLSRTPSTL